MGFTNVFLFFYMIKTGRFPVLTIFEGLYFYAWVLVTFSLVINRLLRVDFIVFFTNVIGFIDYGHSYICSGSNRFTV